MLIGLLLALNIAVCLALIGVVLLQRSEGGALGGGGSPTGLITTRGAGDLLTRTTWILFALFLGLSLALTLVGGRERSSQAILNRLKLQSINPDALPGRAPGSAAAGQATPLPIQGRGAAPLSAPTPTIRLGGASSPVPPAVSLPPLPLPPTPPAKAPAP